MAKATWIALPGGRVKRWKKSAGDSRPGSGTSMWGHSTPPHSYRNVLNRRERRMVRAALCKNREIVTRFIHPRTGRWYL